MHSTWSSITTLQSISCYHRKASRYNPLPSHAVPLSCSCRAILVNTVYCPRSHQRKQVPGILKLTFISPQCIFLVQKMKAVRLDLLSKKKKPTHFVFVWVIQEKHIANHQSVHYTQLVQPNIFRNSYLFPPF